MRHIRRRITTVIVLTAVMGLCRSALAEDWPHWTGPNGTNAVKTMGLPDHFDRKRGGNIKWATRLGDVAFGTPTVSKGRILVGTNMAAMRGDTRFRRLRGGVLACLDEATGERLWNLVSPERTEGFPMKTFVDEQRWGICSSPTIVGHRVYVISNGDDVLCLDLKGLSNGNDGPFQEEAVYMAGEGAAPITLSSTDADIIWRYDMPRELSVAPHDVGSCSVLVLGDVLYTSTSNGIGRYRADSVSDAVNPDAPAFIALNRHTGKLLAVDDTPISRDLFHAQWASPTHGRVNGKELVFLGGSDGFCYAFEVLDYRDGVPVSVRAMSPVWKFDCNPPHYKRRSDGMPIDYAWGDLRAYKRREKLVRDVTRADAIPDKPTRLARMKEALGRYNNGDGSYVGPSEILASPVFYENRVYVATGRDPQHGLGRGVLSCIDATQTGDVSEAGAVWRFEGIGRTMSTVAVANGLVYAADLAGRLYCLDARSGELFWQHDTGHEIWGSPLVADGKVYLNTRQSFWIFGASRAKEVRFSSRGGSECGAIVANGVVYAYIRGQLYALAEEGSP